MRHARQLRHSRRTGRAGRHLRQQRQLRHSSRTVRGGAGTPETSETIETTETRLDSLLSQCLSGLSRFSLSLGGVFQLSTLWWLRGLFRDTGQNSLLRGPVDFEGWRP